jgi:hypothetical protein
VKAENAVRAIGGRPIRPWAWIAYMRRYSYGMAVSQDPAATAVEPLCSLPLVGATTIEDAVFYTAVGAVAIGGLVSWPTAALIGTGHALHQRARNVIRSGAVGQTREGLIEAAEGIV